MNLYHGFGDYVFEYGLYTSCHLYYFCCYCFFSIYSYAVGKSQPVFCLCDLTGYSYLTLYYTTSFLDFRFASGLVNVYYHENYFVLLVDYVHKSDSFFNPRKFGDRLLGYYSYQAIFASVLRVNWIDFYLLHVYL